MIKIEENVEREASCEKRSWLRHQNDSISVAYRQRMGRQTNFNNKHEHKKSVHKNGPKESDCKSVLFSYKSNTNA
jgi:hypothetical protein